jgi:hypothetical protein
METFRITHPGQPYEGPHIGRLLAKKLDTHRWHVLRIEFLDEPQCRTQPCTLNNANYGEVVGDRDSKQPKLQQLRR